MLICITVLCNVCVCVLSHKGAVYITYSYPDTYVNVCTTFLYYVSLLHRLPSSPCSICSGSAQALYVLAYVLLIINEVAAHNVT